MDWESNRTQVGDLEESPGFNLAQFQQDLCKSTFEIKTEIILKQKREKVRGKQLGGEVCGFPTHPAASSSFQTMCNARLCYLRVYQNKIIFNCIFHNFLKETRVVSCLHPWVLHSLAQIQIKKNALDRCLA